MANVNILNLPVAVSVDGSEYFPLVQGGTTKRATVSMVEGYGDGTTAQDENTVYAGPTAAPAAAPTFRALVAADIPASIITLGVGSTVVSSGTTTRVLYDNGGLLGEYAISGTGSVAMTTSPTFVTPTLGVATATTINGLTITSSTGTLTIPNGGSLIHAGAYSATLTFTALTNVTFPTTGTLATLAGAESLSNKTLVSPIITTSPTAAGATWTNLGTVTTADINGGTIDGAIIGGSSAAAITGTTVTGNSFIPNSATVPTDGLYLPAANTPSIAATSTLVASFSRSGAGVNYLQFLNAPGGSGPSISAIGSDTDIALALGAKGAGSVTVYTNAGTVLQFAVTHTASATRYVTATGSNGGNPAISASAGNVSVNPAVVTFGAGTTAVAPATFTSGTNLTTAAAGAVEFDGTCFYASAAASSRQVVGTAQFVTVQGTPVALSNSSTGVQNVFASANDVLTLAASTTYFFECLYFINTGTTSHTTATGFVASSAFTSITYFAELWSTTSGTISTTAPSVLDVAVSTATVLNAASTDPRTTIRCRGIIRTNSASTVTPQITFSAGPTGTCEVAVNSYFRIWPVGSSTVAAVGNWA